jgi:hypothetical protein
MATTTVTVTTQALKKEQIVYTLMTRENMGGDARKTTAKVSRPYRVKVKVESKDVNIKFDTQEQAYKWIKKDGKKENVYYVVGLNDLWSYYSKWSYDLHNGWHKVTFVHPNESMKLIA